MVLKFVYTIFLGLLLATFVGVGIAAFYKSPKMPEQDVISRPVMIENASKSAQMSEEDIKYQKEWKDFNDKQKIYDRNVSAVAMGFSIMYLMLGLLFFKQILMLSDGLLFGSVFTLLYSIARGFNSQDEIFRFFVVSVGLIIALVLGYIKFVKNDIDTKKQ